MANFRQPAVGGSANRPLTIDDDDRLENAATRNRRIEEEIQAGQRLAQWVASRASRRDPVDGSASASQFDDDDAELLVGFEDALAGEIADIIDLTGDDHPTECPGPTDPRERGKEILVHKLENGLSLRAGMTVELNGAVGTQGIEFLRVQSLIQPYGSAEAVILGWGYTRTRQLGGLLPCKLNELALVAELRNSDLRPWQQQALMAVSPSAVKRLRILRVTNAPFPEHRFDSADYATKGRGWIEDRAPLVCRYRYELNFNVGNDKPCEWALVQISEADADPKYAMPDEQVLNRWRGGKVRGGSYNPKGPGNPTAAAFGSSPVTFINLDSDRPRDAQGPTLYPDQRYTAGDVFAGAGGASRGIERSGAHLLFSLDHWRHAAKSLRANFRDSDIYEMEVTDFITSKDIRYTVDILHLSPPCQFWSPAHTVAGQNDEENIAVLFSCGGLIEKFRPRLFTVEQTFGILHPRFEGFFHALVESFTCFGYSVRWKVLPLVNYGVPQLRRRLVMIGAAPGENLPPFPPPTHSKDGTDGLKPWATPYSVVSPLSTLCDTDHPLHNPTTIKRYNPPKPSWDPNRLAKTITTNGGQNYHWSGERDFTHLEYAVLQGFPRWHRFQGSYIKKQIGNAFAPSVVRTLYTHLVKWLLKEDGFDPAVYYQYNNIAVPVFGNNSSSPSSSSSSSRSSAGEEGCGDVIYLGSRSPSPTDAVNGLRQAGAGENGARSDRSGERGGEGEPMEVDSVEDLSDTETLREEEDGGNRRFEGVIDLTGDGNGTLGSPIVLLD